MCGVRSDVNESGIAAFGEGKPKDLELSMNEYERPIIHAYQSNSAVAQPAEPYIRSLAEVLESLAGPLTPREPVRITWSDDLQLPVANRYSA